MQENIENFDNKISKILIDEENDNVVYYMNNGDALRTKLSNIIDNKKRIYKNFRISQKCHELTTSAFKRRKLQKLLNPAIIKVLNDNVEIMEYIRCVKDKLKLPFELEHNTANSTLSFMNRRKMKNIAKNERKLGAKVNIINENLLNTIKKKIKDVGSGIFNEDTSSDKKKRDISILSEGEIDKRCEDVKKDLIKYYQNMSGNIENISELESIELKLKTAINWYIENQRNEKANINILIYKKLLDNEKKYFYQPKYCKSYNENPKEAMLKYAEPLSIKDCETKKLQIRNLLASGKQKEAENLYNEMLNALEIKLTRREMRMTLKEGIESGRYYIQENGIFQWKKINGNEKILRKIKMIEDNTRQPNDMRIKQSSTLNKSETIETQKQQINQNKEKIYSKKEITSIMKKYDNFNDKVKFQKGAIVPVMNALITYLEKNKDEDVQKYLNNILSEFNKIEPIDVLKAKDGRENKYNIVILDYISNLYKDGIKNIDGKYVLCKNDKTYSYYMYLLNRRVEDELGNEMFLSSERINAIKEEYSKNSEYIEFNYFEKLRNKNSEEILGIRNKLLKNEKYSHAILDLENNSRNNSIRLLALSEDLKNGIYRKRVGLPTNLKIYTDLKEKVLKEINSKQLANEDILKIIANLEDNGINDQLGYVIVKPNEEIASELYEKLPYQIENNKEKMEEKTKEKKKNIKNLLKKVQHNKPNNIENMHSNTTKNLYVCSDLHGQYELYKTILNQLKDNDKLFILGDVIDRGPDGIKILQDIEENQDKIELLVGNHELMMIQALFLKNEKEKQNWTREANGGKKTYNDFIKLSPENQKKIKNLLLNATVHTNVKVNNEEINLVHAKAEQKNDKNKETVKDYLDENREEDLYNNVWARLNDEKPRKNNEKWKEEDIGKKNSFTIIGHTPTDDNKIEVHNSYAIVDCGATNYGNGCLLRLNDGKTVYFDNVNRCLEQLKNEEER